MSLDKELINDKISFNNRGIRYIKFKKLDKYSEILEHAITMINDDIEDKLDFSVSGDDFVTRNKRNYKILMECLKIEEANLIRARQTHSDTVLTVLGCEQKDEMCFINAEGYDGLITDKRGIALLSTYADCVPLIFFDPIRKVIATSHSGWRGTVQKIARKTAELMKDKYECDYNDILCFVCPCIMQDCFEVDFDVYEQFKNSYSNIEIDKYISIDKNKKKYYIDQTNIIKDDLVNIGFEVNNIEIADICTVCNKDKFFSYRGGKENSSKRFCAIISLK